MTGQPRQLAFWVDSTRCINCKTCEIACKDRNGAAVGQRPRRVRTFEGGVFPEVFAANLSLSCNHCERPQCVAACPVGAYTKRPEDGVVIHSPERCIGCQYCTWACPYGAPQYAGSTGKVMKCDLCAPTPETAADPACVQACPMRALEVGTLEELAARPGATAEVRNLPALDHTMSATRFKLRAEMEIRKSMR